MHNSASIPRPVIRIRLRPSTHRGKGHGVTATSEPEPSPASTQTRSFWAPMFYAVALGGFGGVAALLFMGVIGVGNNWYTDPDPGWFGGQWWWIAVTAAAGVVVGLLRRLTHLPEHTSGLIADLQDE